MKLIIAAIFTAAAAPSARATKLCTLGSAEPPAARSLLAAGEFRGSFRDLSLYALDASSSPGLLRRSAPPAEACFETEQQGADEGLWVIELDSPAALAETAAALKAAGLPIMHTAGLSVVAGGGPALPSALGLDACGAEVGKAVIPVSPKALGAPASSMDVAQWSSAKNSEPLKAIEDALAEVSRDEMELSIRSLAGFGTRLSYSGEVRDAGDFAKRQFESKHPGATVTLDSWREDMGSNVVAEILGTDLSDEIIVVGAHYDSRNEQGTGEGAAGDAPGADDNASGSSAMLEIARVLGKTGTFLRRTLRIVLFCGEEQGLLGSRALAGQWADEGENIVAMVNADMLGWQIPGAPITLGFKDRYITPELTELARNLTEVYVGIPTGYSESCCSDYQSFYEAGFPSVGFFENPVAASAYPHYHRTTDLPEYVNYEQLELETRAVLATVLTLAEVDEA